jgi:hypothetical protein
MSYVVMFRGLPLVCRIIHGLRVCRLALEEKPTRFRSRARALMFARGCRPSWCAEVVEVGK